MDANIEKELDNGQRVRINLKRKRATRRATYFTEATCPEFPLLPALNKPGKRRKSKGCENKATTGVSPFGKSLLKRYLNFKKSGVPQRLMFYQDGEWTDFPGDLVEIVGKDIFVKKTTSEIEMDGRSYVLDFMHMFKVDLETGCQKPIAWIDEAGKCFFPETFSTDEGYEAHLNCTNESGEQREPDFAESCGSHDIKLQLEIEISGLHSSMLNECIGESNPAVLMTPNEQKPARSQCVMDAEDSYNGETLKVNSETEVRSLSANKKLDYSLVRDMFLKGMKSIPSPDIVDIYPCKGNMLQSRRELFEKQAEITSKCRGSANVQYAWLASSKDALSALMTHGLGYVGSSVSNYGIGIQLAASGFPSIRWEIF